MKPSVKKLLDRRTFFKKAATGGAAIAAGSLVTDRDLEAAMQAVNTMSRPSDLKITDRGLVDVDRFEIVPLEA